MIEIGNKRGVVMRKLQLKNIQLWRDDTHPEGHPEHGSADLRGGPQEWDRGTAGTPHPGGARRLTVTGFNLLVERARILRLTQGPSVSPPKCRSPIGDNSTTVSPPRPMIRGRRHLQAPTSTVDQRSPTQEDRSQNTSLMPVSQCDAARTLEPYLDRVTRVLERLELLVQHPPPVATPRSTPRIPKPTKLRQRTVTRYLVHNATIQLPEIHRHR